MKRRTFLAATVGAAAAASGQAQLRSPAQWLERDGTPRIGAEAFAASGPLQVWLVAMPKPLWMAWWNLLPVESDAPQLIEGLVQDYRADDEVLLSLLVTGAARDESRKRRLIASLTTVAPDGTADPPSLQDYFWEGMPFNRSQRIAVLEPVLGVGDPLGRSAGTWTLHVNLTDTLASRSVDLRQRVSLAA